MYRYQTKPPVITNRESSRLRSLRRFEGTSHSGVEVPRGRMSGVQLHL
jgi:hypothetical protein